MEQTTKYQDFSLLRLLVGAIFLSAGILKWSFWAAPPPGMGPGLGALMKFLSVVEPLGGLAVLLGFWTRRAAAGLAIIMVGAAFFVWQTMHASLLTGMKTGIDYNLLILVCCLTLTAFGAGKWSVDEVWKSTKP